MLCGVDVMRTCGGVDMMWCGAVWLCGCDVSVFPDPLPPAACRLPPAACRLPPPPPAAACRRLPPPLPRTGRRRNCPCSVYALNADPIEQHR